jgi:hypothetical protein
MMPFVLVRLARLAVSNAFATLRLLPMGDRDKDIEIPALRHQIGVLQRQLGTGRPRFEPADRAFLATLLTLLPRTTLRRLWLIVPPDAILACDFMETVTLGGHASTSWPSSNTPPAASASWEPPRIPMPRGSPRPRASWSWT